MSDIAALVANNLDIWTNATQRKSSAGRGGGKRISRYGIERLRALILDLGVRGKLVPQDAADEPAAVLLQKIRKERAATKQKGKTVKAGSDGELSLGSPVETPQGWSIVRLSDVILGNVGGGTPSKAEPSYWGGDIPWASVKDIGKSKFVCDTQDRTAIGLARSSANLVPAGNIILVTRMGLGQLSINTIDLAINQDLRAIFLSKHVDIDYCYNYFLTCKIEGAGMTVKGIKLDDLLAMQFPLPPLAEQRRIVAKVGELMALCDALERESADAMSAHQALVEALLALLVNSVDATELAVNWARLESHFDTLFTTDASIEALKQTILDLAVRGKLVEQDAGDESGAAFFQRIRDQKATIEKGGRQKTENFAQPYVDKVNSTALPDGWFLTRFGDIMISRDAERVPISSADRTRRQGEYDYYGASGVIDKIDDFLFNKPLLLIGEDGANLINRSTPIAFIATGQYWVNNHAHVLDGITFELLRFVEIYINAIDLKPYVTGTAQPKMNQAKMNSIVVVLPPEAEQRRIIAKVDGLMALCNALKDRIADANQTQRHLADAITERAAV